MGTNKRKRKAAAAEEPLTCPVCFEAFKCLEGISDPDDALACPNQHLLCLSCVSKMMKYTDCDGPQCSRFSFTCPICRSHSCLRNVHMVVLGTRSWFAATGLFDHDPEKLKRYMTRS